MYCLFEFSVCVFIEPLRRRRPALVPFPPCLFRPLIPFLTPGLQVFQWYVAMYIRGTLFWSLCMYYPVRTDTKPQWESCHEQAKKYLALYMSLLNTSGETEFARPHRTSLRVPCWIWPHGEPPFDPYSISIPLSAVGKPNGDALMSP